MKIGILTLPVSVNHGGILQLYALQKALKSLGHDAVYINNKKPKWLYPIAILKRILFKLMGRNVNVFQEKLNRRVGVYMQPFIDDYIPQIKGSFFYKQNNFLKLKEEGFEGFVVGSDQVWRAAHYHYIEHFYLQYAWESSKKVAYAASFGTTDWEYSKTQTSICKRLIQNFDSVSVREDDAVKLCQEYFDINSVHVLDPTMLLNKEEYINIFSNNKNIIVNTSCVLAFLLDRDSTSEKLLNIVCNERNKEVVYVNQEIRPSVEQWLANIYYADFVVTDSFHGTVFCILFNKPFITLSNYGRGQSRLTSLLKIFNLQSRLVIDNSNNINNLLKQDINWDNVNVTLQQWRDKSFIFLKQSLN